MKRIRSYTGIWNIERTLYRVGDTNLPFPVTYSQMGWLVGTFFLMLLPFFDFIDGALIRYAAVPIGVTYFMNTKTFDGKKPYRFLYSAVSYFIRPKETFADKPIVKKPVIINGQITVVEKEVYHVSG